MRTTVQAGTLGCGTALIARAKRFQSTRPKMIPSGTPTTVPSPTATLDCQATTDARVRRLGAPGRGDRADGQTAQQRDQQDDSQVAGPPATECGPETVRGDTKDGAHVTNKVRAATDGRSPRSPTSRNPGGSRRCRAVTREYDHGERIEEGAPQLDSRRGTDPRTWEPCPSCDSQRIVPPIAPNRSAILMYP
jgi:hypothetical protein